MLFTADAWPGLADGSITVTFRRWKRPQAKVGGRYRVAGLLLEVIAISEHEVAAITDDDARLAGAVDRSDLVRRLGGESDEVSHTVTRVEFRCIGSDDRVERRADADLDDEALHAIRLRLERLDRGTTGPWTVSTLRLIARYPGIVSTALARQAGLDRAVFKAKVRSLKELGLTESLEVGYRLSPRGEAVLERLGGR